MIVKGRVKGSTFQVDIKQKGHQMEDMLAECEFMKMQCDPRNFTRWVGKIKNKSNQGKVCLDGLGYHDKVTQLLYEFVLPLTFCSPNFRDCKKTSSTFSI